jgi:hypothetical protein
MSSKSLNSVVVAGAQKSADTALVSAAAEAGWVIGFSLGANARHDGCLTPRKHAAVVAGVSQASPGRYFSLRGRET